MIILENILLLRFHIIIIYCGEYAPNLPSERTMLWRSMTSYLSLGRPRLMMGDSNACCDIWGSTSIHFFMDVSESHAWIQMQSSVLQIDVC